MFSLMFFYNFFGLFYLSWDDLLKTLCFYPDEIQFTAEVLLGEYLVLAIQECAFIHFK